MWKTQYISFGGRVVRVNSVLDSLQTYVISLFPIPVKVKQGWTLLEGISIGKETRSYSLGKLQESHLKQSTWGFSHQKFEATQQKSYLSGCGDVIISTRLYGGRQLILSMKKSHSDAQRW